MATPDWLRLQRKIFSRWCNQKLSLSRDIQVNDVVTEIGDGILLINLLEVLSETPFPGKYSKTPKMRVHKIDNLNNALKFVWDSGVQMKVKPSAEDLADGDEKRTLGLIWTLILKFVKFGDDDQLNAKDSLMMWVQNKTQGYKGVSVENFGKDFKDGMALCALIHKHRPKLIDYDSLNPSNNLENLKIAMNAAEQYFGLEQYLSPEDIGKLDENSMVVYVSEYYYGIAEQRKVDLACRRLHKLIKFTVENDAMRKEYNETAESYKGELKEAEVLLEDRTIDNTMEGAKKRIADFYDYKQNAKGELLKKQLQLESLFNNLAMRLSHHKRPAYVPPEGVSLQDVAKAMKHLEECERERNVALHAELNRQIKLLNLDNQHKQQTSKLESWKNIQQEYLETKEVSTSVGAAQYQLARLDTNDAEVQSVFDTTFNELKKLGAYLSTEKYERTNEVESRENDVASWFDCLKSLSAKKRPVLDDDLKRELFRADLRRKNTAHTGKYNNLKAWVAEKTNYLNERESIDTVEGAQNHIGILEGFVSDKQTCSDSLVAQLKSLGQDILTAKYETEHSSNVWETPDEIKDRESTIDSDFVTLDDLVQKKKAVLDDHLKRELFRADLRRKNNTHTGRYNDLKAWVAEKTNYLNERESIDTVEGAQSHLGILEGFKSDKQTCSNTLVAQLKSLGQDILTAKYETEHSSNVWETPDEIKDRESTIDSDFVTLDDLVNKKKEFLDNELDREEKKEALRLQYANAAGAFTRFVKNAIETTSATHFGFTLEETEAKESELDSEDKNLKSTGDSKLEECKSVFQAGADLGVTENVYASQSLDDLSNVRNDLDNAINSRRNNYNAALEKQRENDALCAKFAGLVNPFSEWITEQKTIVSNSETSLEEQLEFVNTRLSNFDSEGSKLTEIHQVQKEIESKEITNNRHTSLNAKDCSVQWDQWKSFLTTKQKMLQEAIEHAKLRGISPEEYKEIEENFAQFDKNNTGSLDTKELRACLYSLGQELPSSKIQEIIEKYGADGNIPLDGFKEFMIVLIGDSDTIDEILAGWKLINRDPAVAIHEKMDVVMDTSDIEYVESTAPKVEGGWDYTAWTQDVFSR